MSNERQSELAIVGGGITGLSAAYYAIKKGVPPSSINIYEATHRAGGKIKSSTLRDGTLVNEGAEFIDSEQEQLRALCAELNVPLKASDDQGKMLFQRRDGTVMKDEQFFPQYEPIGAVIRQHKAELARNPNSALAQRLNGMSMDQYIDMLQQQVEAKPNRNFFEKLLDAITFKQNRVSPEITEMVKHAYMSEAGQMAGNISALQFINEASNEPGSVLASDCAFRVEGGTEKIIEALKAKLEAQGVTFHANAKVEKVGKEANGDIRLQFAGEGQAPVTSKKAIMALPAYALSQVQGLEQLGLSPEASALVSQTQYTNSMKFTVKVKGDVPQANFFGKGFQSWTAGPGQMTFLCNAEDVSSGKISAPQFMRQCMEQYAKANGTTAEQMFERGPGSVVLTNPGKGSGCYASPAPNQLMALEKFGSSMDSLAANNIGIAGSFLPKRSESGLEIGFMECGLNSAQNTVDLMMQPEKNQTKWRDLALAQKVNRQQGFSQLGA
jgi:monoamine oxidase